MDAKVAKTEFSQGDLVRRRDGELIGRMKLKEPIAIATIRGDRTACGRGLFLEETGTYLHDHQLELVARESGPETSTDDIVEQPPHYARWKIEPITFIMRNGFEFWRGNIVKYASRAGFKLYHEQDETQSEVTDLKKVIRYAEMRINQLEGATAL